MDLINCMDVQELRSLASNGILTTRIETIKLWNVGTLLECKLPIVYCCYSATPAFRECSYSLDCTPTDPLYRLYEMKRGMSDGYVNAICADALLPGRLLDSNFTSHVQCGYIQRVCADLGCRYLAIIRHTLVWLDTKI